MAIENKEEATNFIHFLLLVEAVSSTLCRLMYDLLKCKEMSTILIDKHEDPKSALQSWYSKSDGTIEDIRDIRLKIRKERFPMS